MSSLVRGVGRNQMGSNEVQRNHRLIDGKITKYMLPSVMMTMAIQLGNIVDMMLVGNLLGTNDAEDLVLREIAAGSLKGKIIRVGNLMSRNSDGEFQINSITSGFMRNLKGYAAIGAYPVNKMAQAVEFSPIDMVATAVRLLSGTPDDFTVFHAVNGHWIEMGDVVAALNGAGIKVDVVDEDEYARRLSEAMQDEKRNMLVSGLISYLSSDADTVRAYIAEDHTFTKNALYRLGFRWLLTDERYLVGAIPALITMDFFSEED